jgi:hypothetical protein
VLKKHFQGSLALALTQIYPDHRWKLWKFKDTALPHQLVSEMEDFRTLRYFFDTMGEELGVKELPTDWYKVKKSQVLNRKGRKILDKFNGSVIKTLLHVYPEYNWEVWRFEEKEEGMFSDFKQQRKYFDWIADALEMNSLEEWYSVIPSELAKQHNMDLMSLLKQEYDGHFVKALSNVYPEVSWYSYKFATFVPPLLKQKHRFVFVLVR